MKLTTELAIAKGWLGEARLLAITTAHSLTTQSFNLY